MQQPELTREEREVVISVLNDTSVAVKNANYVLNIIAKLQQQNGAEDASSSLDTDQPPPSPEG